MGITFTRSFQVPVWDETVRQRAGAYWSRRGVVFEEVSERSLSGWRGRLTGVLRSSDMRKLRATLSISVTIPPSVAQRRRKEGAEGETGASVSLVCCVIEVDTLLEDFTDWHKAWFELELDTFASFLQQDDEQDARWARFAAEYWKAQRTWAASLGLLGRRMPPADRLAAPTELMAASAPGGQGTELEAGPHGAEPISGEAPCSDPGPTREE